MRVTAKPKICLDTLLYDFGSDIGHKHICTAALLLSKGIHARHTLTAPTTIATLRYYTAAAGCTAAHKLQVGVHAGRRKERNKETTRNSCSSACSALCVHRYISPQQSLCCLFFVFVGWTAVYEGIAIHLPPITYVSIA